MLFMGFCLEVECEFSSIHGVDVSSVTYNDGFYIIYISILGNHILPDEDLASFHWSLLGPEHPLASLKVQT